MKIVVVIVTYNGAQWIEHCLEMLRQSTIPLTMVVVDNCSNDDTRNIIQTKFPEVVLMSQQHNLGFGQGNNVGLKYALQENADYVLLLNQDAYLQPTAIEELLKVADGQNLVSPVHLCGDGSRIDFMFRESLKRAGNQLLDDLLLSGKVLPSYEIGEVCAACWFMPISLIKTVGGFNPLFFQYGEDNNYYTRMVYHKVKVLLAPHARVFHDRKIHGNQKLFTTKQVRIRLLVASCNLNLSLAGRLKKYISTFVKKPLLTTKELFSLLLISGKIIKSRRIETQKGTTWL